MRILFDTSIVLDVLLNRQPWVQDGSALWQANDEGRLSGYVTATTLTNIFYIARRQTNLQQAFQAVDICLQAFEVCVVDRQALAYARLLPGADFEDNLQIACAVLSQLDAIVTRDPAGFNAAAIPAFDATQMLQQL
jgi:predicted nucleic acid-binding protein